MTPKTPLPLAAYRRVSRVGDREEDRLRSPEFQLDAIRRYAKAEGFEVIEFEPELDVSGSKAKRPILDAILSGIREGRLGGIVVAKLDRLSRMKPGDRVRLFEEVEGAGGVILSAGETLDLGTPEGRFTRDLFLGLARMQWERYRDGFDAAKAAAMKRGAPIGPTAFGYARAADGSWVEHAADGPALRGAFKAAAAAPEGRKVQAALDVLGPHGGRTWTTATVRRLLGRTSYLGQHRYGSLTVEVPRLVSRSTWEAAQPEAAQRRRRSADFPLSGVAECGTCGGKLVGARGGTDGRRMYRCAAGLATHKGERCSKPASVSADRLEAWSVERVNADLRRVLDELPPVDVEEGQDVEAAEEAVREAMEERDAFLGVAASLARTLGPEAVEKQAQEHAAAIEAAEVALREVAKRAHRRTITFEGRELTLAEVADAGRAEDFGMAVFPGRGKPIEKRADLVWNPAGWTLKLAS